MLKKLRKWLSAEAHAERWYRGRSIKFAEGLDLLAQSGQSFQERTDWEAFANNEGKWWGWGGHCLEVPFGDAFTLQVQSLNTGIMWRDSGKSMLDIRVFIKANADGEWYMIFHLEDLATKRFNYRRDWVEYLWALIDDERKRQAKEKRKDEQERFRSLDD